MKKNRWTTDSWIPNIVICPRSIKGCFVCIILFGSNLKRFWLKICVCWIIIITIFCSIIGRCFWPICCIYWIIWTCCYFWTWFWINWMTKSSSDFFRRDSKLKLIDLYTSFHPTTSIFSDIHVKLEINKDNYRNHFREKWIFIERKSFLNYFKHHDST